MIELRENYFVICVPNSSVKHHLSFIGKVATSDDQAVFYKHADEEELDEWSFIDLPPGTWKIVCTSKEATEEQLKDAIPELPVGQRWRNYCSDYPVWFHSRRESLRSLLVSKGCDVNKNYLMLKKG